MNDRPSLELLLQPPKLYAAAEVLQRPSPLPAEPGVYAWYFDEQPPEVPLAGTHAVGGHHLLYCGISPKAPPGNGRPPSKQNLRKRIRYHYRGNAAGSTLRLTLGSLLGQRLGIELRRVGSGARMTFGPGESILSEWMAEHVRVCWLTHDKPWTLESAFIRTVNLPLNLDQNRHGSFHAALTVRRAQQRQRARELPVI